LKRIDTLSLIAYISIALLLIPVALLLWLGLAVYRSSLGFGAAVFDSIALTFSASAASSIIIFLLYTPLSYELARRSNAVAESLSDIPASIPHPIAGIALLFLGSNLTPFGRFLNSIGFGLFDSLQGMIAALAFVSAPVYIKGCPVPFPFIRLQAELYSLSLGKSRLSTLYSVVIPRHFRSLISAVLTSMSRAMSEFGSVAIISYYILGGPFLRVQAILCARLSVLRILWSTGCSNRFCCIDNIFSASRICNKDSKRPYRQKGAQAMIDADFITELGNFTLHGTMKDEGIISIQGSNGAGKTTFLLSILGLYKITGTLRLGHMDVSRLPVNRRGAVYIDAETYLPHLDVNAHLTFSSRDKNEAKLLEIKRMFGIEHLSGRVGNLSLGQRLRVSVATAVLSSPKVLMLDEVFAHLSDAADFAVNVRRISKERGFDVIVASQEGFEIDDDHRYTIVNGIMHRHY
jgi:ABC-type sulfate transport system, permease component